MAPQKRRPQSFKELSAPPSKRQNTNLKGPLPAAKVTRQPRGTAAKRTTTKKGASTKHPIEIIEDGDDTELTEEEETKGVLRPMPPPPPPHRCETFPYFNRGMVFIIIDNHDTKYQYRFYKSVLGRCAPRLLKLLSVEVDEFDEALKNSNPGYKQGVRLELIQKRGKWVLVRSSFTMAKPPAPIKTPAIAPADSKTTIVLGNAKTLRNAFDLSPHPEESYRHGTVKAAHNELMSRSKLSHSPKSPRKFHFNGLQDVSGTSLSEMGPKESDIAARHENEGTTYPADKETTNAERLLSQNHLEKILVPSNFEAISAPVPEVPPAPIQNSEDCHQHDLGDLQASSQNFDNEVMVSTVPFSILSASWRNPREQTDIKKYVLVNENQAVKDLQATLLMKDSHSTEVITFEIPTTSTEDCIGHQKTLVMIENELQERIPPCEDVAVEVAFPSVPEKEGTSRALMGDLDIYSTSSGISVEKIRSVTLVSSVSERGWNTNIKSLEEFREPERYDTVELVDEKSDASTTSKFGILSPQTNLEDTEHYQGLKMSATGLSGVTMPSVSSNFASQVGSPIIDSCSDSKSCPRTLPLSTSVAKAQDNHHEQESMKPNILSSSLNASDGLAKNIQDDLVPKDAENVTNMNFDGTSDNRSDIVEEKETSFFHHNAYNNGSPPRDVSDAYHNIFLIFHHNSPQLDTSDIMVALKQSELIIQKSADMGCDCIVRPHICNALFQFGQDLFKAVYSQAPRLLKLGIALESAPIVREAMIHLVGNFSTLKEADFNILKSLGSLTTDLIYNKQLQLKQLCTEVNNKLFRSTIYVNENPVQISSISKEIFDTWVVVQLWHDFFCQSMASFDHQPDKIGTLYRQLLKGGEAYLPPEKVRKTLESMNLCTVTSERVLHNKLLGHLGSVQFSALVDAPLPNQFRSTVTKENGTKPGTFRDLAFDLMLMKDFAKDTVKEICVNNSMLDVEVMGIEYLTYTKIDDSELPWVMAAERQAEKMA